MKKGTYTATQWTVCCGVCGEAGAVSRSIVDGSPAENLVAERWGYVGHFGWVCEECREKRRAAQAERKEAGA